MKALLPLLYTILPKVLNWLSANPQSWSTALEGARRTAEALISGRITKEQRQEHFKGYIDSVLDSAKNPTRMVNFLREAAVLYIDWKSGKLGK